MGTFGNPRQQRPRNGGRDQSGCIGGPVRPISGDHVAWGTKPDYKTAALCKQVRRAVSLTLSGECGDPVLQELMVDEVLPAPNAGRMLVRVMLRVRADGPGMIDVLQRLAKVEGLLRASVGAAIARKRTPELAFDVRLVGPGSILDEVSHD